MVHIEQLQKMSPAAAERFIMTALRFYAETLVNGEPNTYFTKLANVDYPGINDERAEEQELAVKYINWHNHEVALVSTSAAGYENEEEHTLDEIAQINKIERQNAMKEIFGDDILDETEENNQS